MYKKPGYTCTVVVLLIKPIVFCFFWRSRYRPRRWILTSLLVSLRNRMAQRRGRQNACVTNVTGLFPACLLRSSINITVFWYLQKDLLKGSWSLAGIVFKQNYCHACHTRFFVFLRKFTINIISNSIINLPYWNVYNTFTAVFLVGDLKNQPGL